jgi:Acidobacterial duplicated orphan permease
VKLAFRTLLKTPGFTLIAVLTLGLGIGANSGVFSFVNTLLVRPLPLPQVHELVFFGEHSEQVPNMSVAYPNFLDWRERQQSFTHFGTFRGQSFNYIGPSETERLGGAQFSHDLWPALGIQPLLGRWFRADEDKPGAPPTALISESFWRRSFGARPDVIGSTLTVSGEIYTIVGVMPATFAVPNNQTDIWVPLGLAADQLTDRGNHPGLYCIGRLRPGVSVEAARNDLIAIARQLEQEHPGTNTGNSVALQPLVDTVFGQVRTSVWVSFAAACGVLLIACANVANLLLARASVRSREFSIRAALGATRLQLIRVVLAETFLLSVAGTALGLLIGHTTMEAIQSLLPANSPLGSQVRMDFNVFAFSVGVGVGVTLLAGLVPALTASKVNLNEGLSAPGSRGTTGGVHARWRSVLVASEFALTCLLLFASGLMFRTLYNLYRADTGLKTDHVVSFTYAMPGRDWADATKRTQLLDRALARLRELPGVTSVALTNPLPLTGGGNQTFFVPEGTPDPGPGRRFSTENNAASRDYFATMHIPLLRGRTFTDRENPDEDKICIIDSTFAETHFAGQDPIGKRVILGGSAGNTNFSTIVGVVGHVQNFGLGQDTRAQLYFPYRQSPPTNLSFVLRTSLEPAALASSIRAAMREVEPTLPVFAIRTMDELFDNTVTNQRIMLILLGVFGGVALLLAAIGLYGVLSYIVGQRTREVGIRMALGASASSVRRLMLGQGLRLASAGLAVGLLICFAASRLLSSVLYEVSPHDPLSLAAVVALLVLVGLLACWLPARRATKVDPATSLRTE